MSPIYLIIAAALGVALSCFLITKKRSWETCMMTAGSLIALISAVVIYYNMQQSFEVYEEMKTLPPYANKSAFYEEMQQYSAIIRHSWIAEFAGIALFILGLVGYCCVSIKEKKTD